MCICFFSFGVWRYALFFSRLLFFKENRDCDYRGVRVEGVVDGVSVVIMASSTLSGCKNLSVAHDTNTRYLM